MDAFCCEAWRGLWPEVSVLVMKKSAKLPPHFREPYNQFAEHISSFCPNCGKHLSPLRSSAQGIRNQMPVVSAGSSTTCPRCGGKGLLGLSKDDIPVKCSKCLGEGTITTHIVTPERVAQIISQTENILEKRKKEIQPTPMAEIDAASQTAVPAVPRPADSTVPPSSDTGISAEPVE